MQIVRRNELSRNKTIIIVAIIFAVAIIIGLYLYLENERYAIVGTQKGIAFKIDRKTGESWTISPGKFEKNTALIFIKKKDTSVYYEKLPIDEKNKIKGRALLNKYGSLSGTLYNGSSNWTVKEIIVKINLIKKNGKTIWERLYRELITISPLTTKKFNIYLFNNSYFTFSESLEWKIEQVKGILTPISKPPLDIPPPE